MLSQTSLIVCLWVGVTWQQAEWQQWLVYHLGPVEPTRPYAQTEGGLSHRALVLWSTARAKLPDHMEMNNVCLFQETLDSHRMVQWHVNKN